MLDTLGDIWICTDELVIDSCNDNLTNLAWQLELTSEHTDIQANEEMDRRQRIN
jgi:hypothetical protein